MATKWIRTHGGSYSYSNPANWSNGVPTASDSVIFSPATAPATSYTVVIDSQPTLKAATFANGVILLLPNNHTLTVTNATFAAGSTATLAARGKLNVTNALTFTGATLNNSGTVLSGGTMTFNSSSVTDSGSIDATGKLSVNSNSTVAVASTGKLTARNGLAFHGSTLNDSGLVNSIKDASFGSSNVTTLGAGALTVGGNLSFTSSTLTNNGTVSSSGTLGFVGGTVNDLGTITATLALSASSNAQISVQAGASLIASSTLTFNNSTLTDSGFVHAVGNAVFTGGSVTTLGLGQLNADANLTFNGASLTNNGSVTTGLTIVLNDATVNDNGTISSTSFSAKASSNVTVTGPASLATTGNLIFANSQLDDSGTVTVGGVASFTGGALTTQTSGQFNTGGLGVSGTTVLDKGSIAATGNVGVTGSANVTVNPGASLTAGGTLVVLNSTLIDGGTVSSTGNGSYLSSNVTTNAGGVLSTQGLLTFSGSTVTDNGSITGAGIVHVVNFNGSATTFSVGAHGSLSSGDLLYFNNVNVSDSGSISSGNNMTFVGGSLTTSAGSEVMSNANLIFNNVAVDDSGSVSATGGLVVIGGSTTTESGGQLTSGSTMGLYSASVLDKGTISTTSGADITSIGSSLTIGSDAHLKSGQNLVLYQTVVTDAGSVEAAGDLTVTNTSSQIIEVQSYGHIGVQGQVTLTNQTAIQIDANAYLDAQGDIRVLGNSSVTIEGGGDLDSATGAVNLSSGATIYGLGGLSTPATLTATGGLIGSGTVEAGTASAGGTLEVFGQIATTVQLVISAAGPSDLIIADSQTTPLRASQFSISSTNQTLTVGGDLTLNGQETVQNGHVVLEGGTLSDLAGLSLDQGSLTGHGVVTTSSGASNDFYGPGTVTALGGVLRFSAGVDVGAASGATTNFVIGGGSTLAFDGVVGANGANPAIAFTGGHETLDLSGEGQNEKDDFYGVVSGFGQDDSIIVAGSGSAGDIAVYDAVTKTLKVETSNGQTVLDTIHMNDVAANQGFRVTQTNGVDVVTEGSSGGTICFFAGTRVRTPGGEVAVETLKPGDLVTTADGRVAPVNWVGRQTISMRFADPLRVLPIRVRAGALDENVPARDLLVSPDHALLIEGALIQAGALVNGKSIVRESRVPAVFTYYHVETDDHSLILAENTPAETFVDTVDRLNFDNWSEYQALYPEGKTVEELPYPRAKSQRQVPVRVRVKVAERVQIGGFAEQGAA